MSYFNWEVYNIVSFCWEGSIALREFLGAVKVYVYFTLCFKAVKSGGVCYFSSEYG